MLQRGRLRPDLRLRGITLLKCEKCYRTLTQSWMPFFVFLCKYNKSCKNNTVMNYSLNYVRETVLFQTTLCASKIKKLVLISLGNQIIALDRLWSLRYTFKKIYSLCQPPESNDVTVLSLCLFSIGTTSLCWLYKWVSVTVRLKSRVGNVFWKLFFVIIVEILFYLPTLINKSNALTKKRKKRSGVCGGHRPEIMLQSVVLRTQ